MTVDGISNHHAIIMSEPADDDAISGCVVTRAQNRDESRSIIPQQLQSNPSRRPFSELLELLCSEL